MLRFLFLFVFTPSYKMEVMDSVNLGLHNLLLFLSVKVENFEVVYVLLSPLPLSYIFLPKSIALESTKGGSKIL